MFRDFKNDSFLVSWKFLSDEVETIFWESKAKLSGHFKSTKLVI